MAEMDMGLSPNNNNKKKRKKKKQSLGESLRTGLLPCKGDSSSEVARKLIFLGSLCLMIAALVIIAVHFISLLKPEAPIGTSVVDSNGEQVVQGEQQVIVNLLENCVLHADGMTKIWLIVTEDGDQVKFSVEDDGAGIEESVLPRMFDGSFQSEDGKESDSKRNMGIGLSVCMTIVRAHDGIMKAENRKEGGARVMFWLPKGVDTEYGD